MGYVVSNHGSDLLVAAQAVDERTITHALDRLKTGLFLDVDYNEEHGCLEYKVRLRYSRSEPPVFVCGWRDEHGRPLPLSSALIEHVKKLIETDTSAQVNEHNRKVRADASRATGDEAEEIAREMLPIIQGKKGAVLPRSQSLRMARDKRRSRGEKA